MAEIAPSTSASSPNQSSSLQEVLLLMRMDWTPSTGESSTRRGANTVTTYWIRPASSRRKKEESLIIRPRETTGRFKKSHCFPLVPSVPRRSHLLRSRARRHRSPRLLRPCGGVRSMLLLLNSNRCLRRLVD